MTNQFIKDTSLVLTMATAPAPINDIPQELLRVYPQPREDDNAVNKAIYNHLIKRYLAENGDWLPELLDEFKSENKVLDYRISRSTGFCCIHKIGRWMAQEMTWPRFWTLRIMFGPTACANQGWFDEFANVYPMALDDAPAGIVPENYEELFGLPEWVPEEPQLERWTFHATNTTRYGKRKAVKVVAVNRKRPKFTGSSSMRSSNAKITAALPTTTNIATALPTTAAFEVRIIMTAQDERTITAPQGSHGQESRHLNDSQQPSQQFSDTISLMEDAIKQCNALHRAQAESLEFLSSQMQLVKDEHRAKEKRLQELLAQERGRNDSLEDRLSRLEQAIKREEG